MYIRNALWLLWLRTAPIRIGKPVAVPRRGVRCARLNDKSIVLLRRARAYSANELFLHKEGLVIRARRVEVHPPTLVICSPLGRLPNNVEGARPTLFSASKANERAGIP